MPNWIRVLGRRMRGWVSRRRLDEEFQQELETHLEMLIEENLRRGMSPEEARRRARVQLGGITQLRETNREMWGLPCLETVLQDLRYGLRQLLRNPGFTAVAILTLALGIGANTAIFSVVSAVLLRHLPYSNPGRLVCVTEPFPHEGASIASLVPDPDYLHWRNQNQSFQTVAAYGQLKGLNLAGNGGPVRTNATAVTWDFFPMLGVRPVLGRNFLPVEDRPGGPPVVVLSHSLWKQRFRSDPNVVGKTVELNEKGYTVIGVMPASFHFPANWSPELFIPLGVPPNLNWDSRSFGAVYVIGRLKPGVKVNRALSDLITINERSDKALKAPFNRVHTKLQVRIETLHEHLMGNVRPLLLILLGAVGFVLLLACANVANLQLARAAVREGEFAIRSAIGAGRSRLARQMLVESLALAAMGGVAGLILGAGGVALFRHLRPPDIPGLVTVGLDPWVFVFTAAITVLAGVASGLAPGLVASNTHLDQALKEAGQSTATGGGTERFRGLLMVSEVALALILLTGAALLVGTFARLVSIDPGFDPHHLFSARIMLALDKYPKSSQWTPFFQSVLERVEGLPGVESVTTSSEPPLTESMDGSVEIEGRTDPRGVQRVAVTSIVSPSYFRTLRIPLLSGREFTPQNNGSAPKVAIVNDIFARQYFGHESPIGHRIRIFMDWYSIVGVVGSTRHLPLTNRPSPETFVCYLQKPFWNMMLIVRTSSDAGSLAAAVRSKVQEVDPNQPIFDVVTMKQRFSKAVAPQRFNALVMAVLAILAVILSAVGAYGVMAYSVARRTHEIGIRMALGAEKHDVLRMVIGQGLGLALIGVAIGVAGALALTRFLASLLYGVKPTDPLTFVAVSLILIAVALVACYIPARRASKVDPMVALRYE